MLLTTWPPTFAFFRNPWVWGEFRDDLRRFKRMMDGKLDPLPRAMIPSVAAVKALAAGPFVTVDIETAQAKPGPRYRWTSKNPLLAKLKLLGLGNTEWGISIIPSIHVDAYRLACKLILANPKVVKVWQNGDWYDLRCLAEHGVVIRGRNEDTRDARRALVATSDLDLGSLATYYTDPDPWKKKEEASKGDFYEGDVNVVRQYNVKDVVYDARVWKGITEEPEWNTPRVQRLYEVHRKLARIAAKMHTRGVPIDRERYVWMKWALFEEYREREAEFLRAVGIPGFRCNPDYMRRLIYKRHATGKWERFGRFNLPDPELPDMYSDDEMTTCAVDEDALIQLLIDPSTPPDLKPLIKLYWAAEEVWKRRSTFVASKNVRHAIGEDWYLRPGWNSCGTDTGRFSCSSPNVMNIEKLLRWMYRAKPGRLLIGADWKQQELRMRRAITGDEVLGDALVGDVYCSDVRGWFGIEGDDALIKEEHSKERKACKIGHLGCQYGAGAATVHKQGLKQDKNLQWALTKRLHAQFRERYKRTVEWWDEEHKRVLEIGYSETRILGRRRHYPREPPPTETSNFPIQGTSSDMKNLCLIELDERLEKDHPDSHIFLDLHDAIYVDAPARKAERVRKVVAEVMEQPFEVEGQKWEFPTDIQVGESWDEL